MQIAKINDLLDEACVLLVDLEIHAEDPDIAIEICERLLEIARIIRDIRKIERMH